MQSKQSVKLNLSLKFHIALAEYCNTMTKLVDTGLITLYPHQEDALKRMPIIEQEGRGGVLAFEPGLGKTITVVAHLKHMKETEESHGCDLIVCPVAVITHWVEEIKSVYSDKQPKILVYYGSKRDPNKIRKKWDFIITTYDILKSVVDGSYEINKRFVRIVLDEAHNIKNGSRNKCPAIATAAFHFASKSKYKWCITGTPFNNSIMDLASLAMFIGTKGYTEPSDWREGAINVNEWREKYVIIVRKDGLLKAPVHHDVIINPTKKEADLCEALRDVASKQFDKWLEAEGKDKIKHQGTLLGIVAKMRQCSDSYHVIGEKYKKKDPNVIYNKSAKVQETIKIIKEKLYGDNPDPSNGIVVFSQFTRYLELLEKVISELLPDIDIYFYAGSSSKDDRDWTVSEFTKDTRPRVLLISLFAGGVGLNLKPCSTLILSEPWYNPFVEQQAEDRVHRLGQNNQVNVYRLTMENSVEKWIQGIKMSKLTKAAEVGLTNGVPKKGMGGISSTFKMEDLANLFDKYVGMKKDGQLINPKKTTNQPNLTRDEFVSTINEWLGEDGWELVCNPDTNKDYYGGGCVNTTMSLEDFYQFAENNQMTYANKIGKRKNPQDIDVDVKILPGRRGNVQLWYTIHDAKTKGEICTRLKHNDWRRINVYLKNWHVFED